jgi:hypothetical protein
MVAACIAFLAHAPGLGGLVLAVGFVAVVVAEIMLLLRNRC